MGLKTVTIIRKFPDSPGTYWLKKGKNAEWEAVQVLAGNEGWPLNFYPSYQNMGVEDIPLDWEWGEEVKTNKPV